MGPIYGGDRHFFGQVLCWACYFRAFLAGNGDWPSVDGPSTDFIVAAGDEGEKNQIAKQQFIIEIYHCVSMKKTARCAVFSPLLTN